MRCLTFVVIMPPWYKSRQRPPSPAISIAFSSGYEASPIVHRPVLASTATGTANCHSRTRTCMSCALLLVIHQHSPLQIVIIPHRAGVVCDIWGYSLAAASEVFPLERCHSFVCQGCMQPLSVEGRMPDDCVQQPALPGNTSGEWLYPSYKCLRNGTCRQELAPAEPLN